MHLSYAHAMAPSTSSLLLTFGKKKVFLLSCHFTSRPNALLSTFLNQPQIGFSPVEDKFCIRNKNTVIPENISFLNVVHKTRHVYHFTFKVERAKVAHMNNHITETSGDTLKQNQSSSTPNVLKTILITIITYGAD
jgi:hypothetical protein